MNTRNLQPKPNKMVQTQKLTIVPIVSPTSKTSHAPSKLFSLKNTSQHSVGPPGIKKELTHVATTATIKGSRLSTYKSLEKPALALNSSTTFIPQKKNTVSQATIKVQ